MPMTERGRVLAVDDQPMNLDILRKILRKEYDVETACDGEECLRKLPDFRPQLVLLDIMMPGLDGYAVCRRIKEATTEEFVQVILVSAKGSTAERLQGYECQADDFLVKPFNHDELLSKVRVQFRLWEAHREVARARDELRDQNGRLESLVAERTWQVVVTRDVTVFLLAQLAESRDPETGNHLHRIRVYARILAEELRGNFSITP
jgi:putative two-component system response regulator